MVEHGHEWEGGLEDHDLPGLISQQPSRTDSAGTGAGIVHEDVARCGPMGTGDYLEGAEAFDRDLFVAKEGLRDGPKDAFQDQCCLCSSVEIKYVTNDVGEGPIQLIVYGHRGRRICRTN